MEDKKMKEIKYVSFSEMILIPAKNKFERDYPLSHYVGSLKGDNGKDSTTVHVMVFNCLESAEIPSLIDLEIKNLNDFLLKNPEKNEFIKQIYFFSNLKKEIETLSLNHEPPTELINCLSEKSFYELDKTKVIFISGVSSLIEA